jgi:hypothetical protein
MYTSHFYPKNNCVDYGRGFARGVTESRIRISKYIYIYILLHMRSLGKKKPAGGIDLSKSIALVASTIVGV